MSDCIGDDPVELRPASRRLSYTHADKPTIPGLKGGAGRSGASLERDAAVLTACVGIPVVIAAAYGVARLVVFAADAAGRAMSVLF